jgi:hypothetical protein
MSPPLPIPPTIPLPAGSPKDGATPVSAATGTGIDTTQNVEGEKKAPAPGEPLLIYDDNEVSVVSCFDRTKVAQLLMIEPGRRKNAPSLPCTVLPRTRRIERTSNKPCGALRSVVPLIHKLKLVPLGCPRPPETVG